MSLFYGFSDRQFGRLFDRQFGRLLCVWSLSLVTKYVVFYEFIHKVYTDGYCKWVLIATGL